jgi:hypothetical protein
MHQRGARRANCLHCGAPGERLPRFRGPPCIQSRRYASSRWQISGDRRGIQYRISPLRRACKELASKISLPGDESWRTIFGFSSASGGLCCRRAYSEYSRFIPSLGNCFVLQFPGKCRISEGCLHFCNVSATGTIFSAEPAPKFKAMPIFRQKCCLPDSICCIPSLWNSPARMFFRVAFHSKTGILYRWRQRTAASQTGPFLFDVCRSETSPCFQPAILRRVSCFRTHDATEEQLS